MEQKSEKNTGMAVVSYLVFFVPLLTDDAKDPFVKFHVKQGLLLVISFIASSILTWIPFIGYFMSQLAYLLVAVIWVLGVINAISGKQEPVPVIGKYAEKWFKF